MPMTKVVIRVFLSLLQNFDMYFEKPKLPFESVSRLMSPPNNRHTSMTQTFSASMFWSDSLHVVRKPVPPKKMAATIDPTIMHSTHRLVATAPIMIKRVVDSLIEQGVYDYKLKKER